MTRTPTIGSPGEYLGETRDESDHFYTCVTCGQAVDCRDLGEVFHHEEDGHAPLVVQ
jgi:hypothetical protein